MLPCAVLNWLGILPVLVNTAFALFCNHALVTLGAVCVALGATAFGLVCILVLPLLSGVIATYTI